MTQTDVRHLRKGLKMIYGQQIDLWSDWKVKEFFDRSRQSMEIRESLALVRAQIKVGQVFDLSPERQNYNAFQELCICHEAVFGVDRYSSSYNPRTDYVEWLRDFKRRHSGGY